jgi:hypothetical protein
MATAETSGEKTPKTASEKPLYTDDKAAWRVSKIQLIDPYGWHDLNPTEITRIQLKLATFERNTWKELFVRDAKWNHRISSGDLKCPVAKAWMKAHMPDQPYLWTLRLSNTERVWGILSERAYLVVFWDPEHKIWEVQNS